MALDLDLVAEALPTYDVGDELGRGAWGVVLAGRHRQLGRDVAIKQLPRAFGADPAVRKRFVAEARLLGSLDHPHIVPIYDYVEHEGLCLLVMERLGGGTVWSRFRGEGLTRDAACAVVIATCAGLHYAHEKGVLHRDVKPENLMFSNEGVLKVTDFGIAKVVGGSATMATRTGFVLGTPAYIAPEQVRGDELGPATDVYATGTVLYELLSGNLPFPEVADPVAALYQRVHEQSRPLLDTAPDIPASVAEVVEHALRRDPAERYSDAQEFGSALARAAGEAWGEAWVNNTGVKLRGVGPMLPTPAGPASPAGGGVSSAPTARSATTVKAQHSTRAPAAAAVDLSPEELVPLAAPAKVTRRRPGGRGLAAAGAAVAAIGVVVALVAGGGGGGGGGGSPTGTGGSQTGTSSSPAGAAPSGSGVTPTGRFTSATPEALRVAEAWYAAWNSGDDEKAASYFAPGANANGQVLKTHADAVFFNSGVVCAGPVTAITVAGDEVTLNEDRLGNRPHHPTCGPFIGKSGAVTVKVRNGKIVTWM